MSARGAGRVALLILIGAIVAPNLAAQDVKSAWADKKNPLTDKSWRLVEIPFVDDATGKG